MGLSAYRFISYISIVAPLCELRSSPVFVSCFHMDCMHARFEILQGREELDAEGSKAQLNMRPV